MKGLTKTIWITNESDYISNSTLIKDFFKLYEDPTNFPDPDERENPDFIKERIITGSRTPYTHLLMMVDIQEANKIIAGAIVDYYPVSEWAMLTYLFVRSNFRNKGLASQIIVGNEGLKKGIEIFKSLYAGDVKAFLFESNNPDLTDLKLDSMNPKNRLNFFKHVGAKVIDIPYIQPSLDSTKLPVNNLYALVFPELGSLKNNIPLSSFNEFYIEFCHSLEANENFINEQLEIHQKHILHLYNSTKEIPLIEISIH